MVDVPHVPLKEFFNLFAPKYVLGTTYTVSLAFFEGLIYPEIKRSDLRRCLILCDKLGFQRATVESSALRSVGREYMALCAPAKHSFHPKVWVMIGDGKAAVLVGSGNLTQSGFMDNAEMFDVVQLETGGPHRDVAADVARFIAGLRALWSGVDARRLLPVETLEDMQRKMEDLASHMPVESDADLRFLSNFDRPLVEQFGDVFLGGTLRVASPYFGGSTAGLDLLREQLSPSHVQVFPGVHSGNELDVNLSELQSDDSVTAHALKMARRGAFAHLKLYGFDSEGGQWIFTTSANCTLAALAGDNVEAGLLRRVDQSLLDEYFAEQPRKKLPDAQRANDYMDGRRWLTFWGSDRGDAIELLVAAEAATPLSEVTVTVKVNGVTASRSFEALFANNASDRIAWSEFRQITDKADKPALVSIEATDSTGKEVKGDALVDNPLLLSSDPTHRSAWRAALSLLEGEGLPDSADLASVFHLVQDVFDAEDEKSSEAGEFARAVKRHSPKVIPDKVPIWPPIADLELLGRSAGSGRLHDLQWFQKILAAFLNPKRAEKTAVVSVTTADSADEDVQRIQIPTRVAKSIWKQASSSYEQLGDRLSRLVVTRNAAKKIWAVSTVIFLVTLLTRRQLLERIDGGLSIPAVGELARDFLRMLFVDRNQPEDFCPSANCRYEHPTFPSIASDLHESFQQDPSSDIAGLICMIFAYWNVSEERKGGKIPTMAWLQFREVAPDVAMGKCLDRDTLRVAFEKYVLEEAEGIDWSDMEQQFEQLSQLGWTSHDGYRELAAIMQRAVAGVSQDDGFPDHLEDHWSQASRRIQSGREWCFTVDPFGDTCAADDCSGQFVTDARKRRDFRRLAPTICSACGAILVPERLWRAYEENREHTSK